MGVSAVLSFLLLAVVALLLMRAFLAPPRSVVVEESPTLRSRKEAMLEEIRDIDMDFATGKLSDDDYRMLRARYVAEAAALAQAIDRPVPAFAGPVETAAIAQPAPANASPVVSRGGPGHPALPTDHEIERMIASRRASLEIRACPGCGAEVAGDDLFCRKCGAGVRAAEPGRTGGTAW
ncbi:MAG: hypothetical protein HY775_05015 [Acidobacteria bacterium]|nr:hypothetical protein [Acidobacteriota bacterium]